MVLFNTFFSCNIFFNFLLSKPWIRIRNQKNAGPGSALNQCGSETLPRTMLDSKPGCCRSFLGTLPIELFNSPTVLENRLVDSYYHKFLEKLVGWVFISFIRIRNSVPIHFPLKTSKLITAAFYLIWWTSLFNNIPEPCVLQCEGHKSSSRIRNIRNPTGNICSKYLFLPDYVDRSLVSDEVTKAVKLYLFKIRLAAVLCLFRAFNNKKLIGKRLNS